MNLLLTNQGDVPIYEQIVRQIKALILTGELPPGYALPGMRTLARDLHISLITTKRAYDELQAEGYIETIAGKGSFVAQRNHTLVREEGLVRLEELLDEVLTTARLYDISYTEVIHILDTLKEASDD